MSALGSPRRVAIRGRNPDPGTIEAHEAGVLLTTTQAAAYTPYTAHGLEKLRSAGRGPAFIKIDGGRVAYRLADLLAWQSQHRVSTLDQD